MLAASLKASVSVIEHMKLLLSVSRSLLRLPSAGNLSALLHSSSTCPLLRLLQPCSTTTSDSSYCWRGVTSGSGSSCSSTGSTPSGGSYSSNRNNNISRGASRGGQSRHSRSSFQQQQQYHQHWHTPPAAQQQQLWQWACLPQQQVARWMHLSTDTCPALACCTRQQQRQQQEVVLRCCNGTAAVCCCRHSPYSSSCCAQESGNLPAAPQTGTCPTAASE